MRFQMYELGALLHKSLDELEDMTVEEFVGWQAWHRIRERDRQNH